MVHKRFGRAMKRLAEQAMQTPLFLDLGQVMRLHASVIERYGGTEGTRDVGLLQSAVAMPQMAHGGEDLHADVFEMTAAYLYHIVQNHPFLDGNKRTDAAGPSSFWTGTMLRSRPTKTGLSS